MKDDDFLYQHPLYYISGNESKTLEEIKKPANEIADLCSYGEQGSLEAIESKVKAILYILDNILNENVKLKEYLLSLNGFIKINKKD